MKTVTMTPKAIDAAKRMRAADATATGAMLRLMVVGGGCSGLSYKLSFESKKAGPGEKVLEMDPELKLIVDPKSFIYIAGMQVDYTDGLNGTGFVFRNPNARENCGCGSSFTI